MAVLILAKIAVGFVLLVLAVLLGALLLQAACKSCGVARPSYLKALGVFVVVGATWLVVFLMALVVVGAVVGRAGAPTAAELSRAREVINAIVLIVTAPLSALLYMLLLRTSFLRGLGVWLVQLLMWLAVGICSWLGAFVIRSALIR